MDFANRHQTLSRLNHLVRSPSCVASLSSCPHARRLAVLLHLRASSPQSRSPPAIVTEPLLPEVRRSGPPDPTTQVSSSADPVAQRELSLPSSPISSPLCQAQKLSLAPSPQPAASRNRATLSCDSGRGQWKHRCLTCRCLLRSHPFSLPLTPLYFTATIPNQHCLGICVVLNLVLHGQEGCRDALFAK